MKHANKPIRPSFNKGEPARFFYDNACYSYDPKTQSPEEGRAQCALLLAIAEREASDAGCSFQWNHDDTTSAEFSDEEPAYLLYVCTMYDGNAVAVGCVGGVDFGPDGTPYSNEYRRVMEAELAQEWSNTRPTPAL